MGAGGALGCVSAGGVAERDGGGARDHLGEAAEVDARCACDADARAQAGDCRAEGAAGETCAKEKLIMPLAWVNSRRSLALPVAWSQPSEGRRTCRPRFFWAQKRRRERARYNSRREPGFLRVARHRQRLSRMNSTLRECRMWSSCFAPVSEQSSDVLA